MAGKSTEIHPAGRWHILRRRTIMLCAMTFQAGQLVLVNTRPIYGKIIRLRGEDEHGAIYEVQPDKVFCRAASLQPTEPPPSAEEERLRRQLREQDYFNATANLWAANPMDPKLQQQMLDSLNSLGVVVRG
jgi:hypothetical protein